MKAANKEPLDLYTKVLEGVLGIGNAARDDALIYGYGFIKVDKTGAMKHMPVKEVLAWADQIGPLTQDNAQTNQGAGDQAADAE